MNREEAKVIKRLKSKVVPILIAKGVENGYQLIHYTRVMLGYDSRITNHPAYAIMKGELPTIAQAEKLMIAFGISLDDIYEFTEDV